MHDTYDIVLACYYIGSSSDEYSSELPKVADVLTKADIQTICEKLMDAQNDWFFLGSAFRLEDSQLKAIEHQHRDDKRCLMEMISKRLELAGSENPVTWPYICECLKSPNVRREDIATQLVDSGLC